jgi:hypothetical protein
MKTIRGDKPTAVGSNMEHENPCVATFISNELKYHVFRFLFSFIFSPTKSENRRVEQVLPTGEDLHQ